MKALTRVKRILKTGTKVEEFGQNIVRAKLKGSDYAWRFLRELHEEIVVPEFPRSVPVDSVQTGVYIEQLNALVEVTVNDNSLLNEPYYDATELIEYHIKITTNL